MSTPRRLLLQARFVLAAWLLSLGVAIAAPVLRPVALEMVCTAAGMRMVERSDAGASASEDGGVTQQARSLLDCPLCAPAGAPPAALPALPQLALPAHRVAALPVLASPVRSDAPPPGRGPPALATLA